MNFQDSAQAALKEMLKEAYVLTVSEPVLCTVKECGQHYSFINVDFGVFLRFLMFWMCL